MLHQGHYFSVLVLVEQEGEVAVQSADAVSLS
jgi:hypothetical protein